MIKVSWKSLLIDDKGLGDTIARTTDYVGIKKCGGCAKRQDKLNSVFKYREWRECDFIDCDLEAKWEAKEWPRAYCQKHYEMLVDTKVFVDEKTRRKAPSKFNRSKYWRKIP